MLKIKGKLSRKIRSKALTGILGVASILLVCLTLANAFATASDYSYDGATISLDGTTNTTAYTYLRTAAGGTFYTMQGDFSLSETNDANNYITLQNLIASGTAGSSNVNLADGRLMYRDMDFVGYDASANGTLMIAIYEVNKDTPAGNYTVTLSNAAVVGGTSGFGGENLPTMTATITVTRSDEPEEPNVKPSQVVTFRDSENNPITEITKYYGDEDFIITRQVTTGDGEITEYHPDDDGSGTVAHTVPGGDYVGVGEPGDVEICAWVDETENYAATRACYTVHVLKRPLGITGAVIEPKTYDGTSNGTVASVSFEDKTLNNDEYEATATFDDVNAGEDIDVHVSVTLINDGADHYVLNASNFDTTATITPYNLIRDNVTLLGSGTYGYSPDGVEPGVSVEAPTHGGSSTLVEGQDYEVAYSNNNNVTNEAHVTVTGIGNYKTDVPVVIDFTIEPKGINNSNLSMPSSVMKGHIVTPDDIVMTVDGQVLTRCENSGDPECDYILEISGSNTGTVGDEMHVAISGCNNYTGVAVGDIIVVEKTPQTVTISDVTNTVVPKIYGDANFQYEATSDGDGTITYESNNTAVATVDGNGVVTIVGVGEASIIATAEETDTYAQGSASYTVNVAKKTIELTGATVENKVYDGTTSATATGATLSDNALVYGTDYSVNEAHFPSATVGDYNDVYVSVVLSGAAANRYQFNDSGATSATINASASITNFELNDDNTTVVLSATEFTYSGGANEPTATVTVDLDGDGVKETPLTAGTDYLIDYSSNTDVGTATVTIVGQESYVGEVAGIEFTINPASVTDVNVTAPSQVYTGEALEPVPTVTGTVNGENMTFTTDDYEISAHGNFITVGDYNFSVTAKAGSNYNIPTTNGTFSITKANSGEPAEMTAGLEIEAGETLADLGTRTTGFSWADASATVSLGSNTYAASYTKNNDTENYTTEDLMVPVYGLKRVDMLVGVSDGGEVTGSSGTALEGDEVTLTFAPDEGYELAMVTVNGEDRTDDVSNGKLVVTVGTDDITVVALYRRSYEVIRGAGQTHIRGVDEEAEFEIDAEYGLFEDGGEVYVDGNLVATGNYEASAGSTIITFTAEYMDSLALGEHELAVEFGDGGIARTTFTIADPEEEDEEEEESPAAADTGAFTSVSGGAVATGLSVATMIALAGILWTVRRSRRA